MRPTIIESALERPRPGWLEGIKVADPLILAYAARGLTHLPGRAANRIDIVPVDHVAHACVVAAAHPPEEKLRTIAVASSARNPLAIGELAVHIREYFRANPLPGRERQADQDRRARVRRAPRGAAQDGAARAPRLRAWPGWRSPRRSASPRSACCAATAPLAERVTRMVKIYGAYTDLDCVFDDSNACALARSLPEADRAELPFDTAAIDWEDYLQQVHLPEVRKLATGE